MNPRIILVEPQGPLNLGSVARVMKNMGLTELWLVNPCCSPQDPDALLMAVHGEDILESAQLARSLPEALVGCDRALGTAGRIDQGTLIALSPPIGLSWLQEAATGALVFGAEDRGLSNEELQYCQGVIRIPTAAAYPSLNLAQAVAICCYQWQMLEKPPSRLAPVSSAPIESLEGFFTQLEKILLEIGYLYPHTAFARMQKFRKMTHRCQLSPAEVSMLRGVLTQIDWAIHSPGGAS